jgi:hypothetical protein
MIYTEWLRVRGALKWTAIVLGILLVLCGIARLATFRYDAMGFVHGIANERDSKSTTTTLADGTKRTVIVNAREQILVTIDDRGYDGQHIDIIERKSHSAEHDNLNFGSLSIRSIASGRGEETSIDTNDATFFGDFTVIGLVVAIVVATILGAPFAKERDGHLEIALTKPIGRVPLALQTMLADCAGIVAGFAIGFVFAIAVHAIFQSLKVRVTPQDGAAAAVAILGPIAWYAMLNAATASMKRGYGVVLGFAWPVAGVIVLLTGLPSGNVIRDAIRSICHVLSLVDPLAYLNPAAASPQQLVMLVVLALVYGTLAAFQWQRVEA